PAFGHPRSSHQRPRHPHGVPVPAATTASGRRVVPQLVFDLSPRSELSGVTVFSNLQISGNRTRMTWRGRRPQPKTLRLPILCGFREILKTAEDRKSQRLSSDSESCHKFKPNMRRMLSLRKFLRDTKSSNVCTNVC